MFRSCVSVALIAFIYSNFSVHCDSQTSPSWDSVTLWNSHLAIAEQAIHDLLSDPTIPANLRYAIEWGDTSILEYVDGRLTDAGTYGEAIHGQTKESPPKTGADYYASQAVGNNGGTNHPEFYWQSAVAHYRNWQTTGNV